MDDSSNNRLLIGIAIGAALLAGVGAGAAIVTSVSGSSTDKTVKTIAAEPSSNSNRSPARSAPSRRRSSYREPVHPRVQRPAVCGFPDQRRPKRGLGSTRGRTEHQFRPVDWKPGCPVGELRRLAESRKGSL